MTKIKICGLTEPEAAKAAAEAGADYLGVVLAPSHRQLSPEKARELCAGIHRSEHQPPVVGVFVNAPAAEVNGTADYCRLDLVQLSGDESWRYCREIDYPIIKVIHITAGMGLRQILGEIDMGYQTPLKYKPLFLLDSGGGNAYGGSGISFDWRLAGEVAARFPVFVAGGLNPDNVTELITKARPWGVDVSSGVESDGVKDSHKIRGFIEAIKQVEARRP